MNGRERFANALLFPAFFAGAAARNEDRLQLDKRNAVKDSAVVVTGRDKKKATYQRDKDEDKGKYQPDKSENKGKNLPLFLIFQMNTWFYLPFTKTGIKLSRFFFARSLTPIIERMRTL